MTSLALVVALLAGQGDEEPTVLKSLAQEAAVMTTWGCAGRTNPGIAPSVATAYESSRQAALAYVSTASAEIKQAIGKGTSELQVKPEAIGKAAQAVGSARRKFFALLFTAELGEAAEACGSRPPLDSYDCTKTGDIISCIAASEEPFSRLAGWMVREAERGTTAKERLSLLDAARVKVLERLWKKMA
jgi:hypothetical protein